MNVTRVPGVTNLDIGLLVYNKMKQTRGLCASFLVDSQMLIGVQDDMTSSNVMRFVVHLEIQDTDTMEA